MNKLDIEIVKTLSKGTKTIKELTKELKISKSYLSERGSFLEKEGYLEKKSSGRIVFLILKSPLSIYLKKLINEFNPKILLDGKKDKILTELLESKTIDVISRDIGASPSTVYRDLRGLKQIGAVIVEKGKYLVNPQRYSLIEFAKILREERKYRGIEPSAIVLWRKNNEILEKLPIGQESDGALTGFSKFSENGVEYIPTDQYIYKPKKDLTVEEIFAHALKASERKAQRTITAIFYLKNQDKISTEDVKKEVKKYGIFDLYLNMLSYLSRKENSQFLPWNEFLEKAELYNVTVRDYFNKDTVEKKLKEIGEKVKKKLDLYLIGGGNMMYRGLKDSTKDVDIIAESKDAYLELIKALKELKYRESASDMNLYKKLSPSTIMTKNGSPRLDIFTGIVCGGIKITDEIKRGRELLNEYGRMRMYLLAPEIIFLLKSITDREGDLEDARILCTNYPLNWNRILDEVKRQERLSGKTFSFAVLDTLEVLKDKWGINSPILGKMQNYCIKNAIMLALKKPKTITEFRKLIKFPRNRIERAIKNLEKEGKIRIDRSRKPYIVYNSIKN